MAPDGSKLFFISNRPAEEGLRAGGAPRSDFDIWFVERGGAGWSRPKHLGPPVNSPAQTQTRNGMGNVYQVAAAALAVPN